DHAAGLGGGGDELGQARLRAVVDACEPHASAGALRTHLDRDRDDLFLAAAPVAAGRLRADKGLVDLKLAYQPVTPRAYHRPAQLVQQRPGGLVARQPERTLERERAHARLLIRHIPGGGEPGHERQTRVGQDRARRHRTLQPAARTAPQAAREPPGIRPAAAPTAESL